MGSEMSIRDSTDILTCHSKRDIENVNLVASLLVHRVYDGLWAEVGRQFAHDVEALLARHMLSGVLDTNWSLGEHGINDFGLHLALEELADYAFSERERIQSAIERDDLEAAKTGILFEMRELLEKYRTIVTQG